MVNLSPSASSAHESLCSLRFAAQVSQVEVGKPKKRVVEALAPSEDGGLGGGASACAAATAAAAAASAPMDDSHAALDVTGASGWTAGGGDADAEDDMALDDLEEAREMVSLPVAPTGTAMSVSGHKRLAPASAAAPAARLPAAAPPPPAKRLATAAAAPLGASATRLKAAGTTSAAAPPPAVPVRRGSATTAAAAATAAAPSAAARLAAARAKTLR